MSKSQAVIEFNMDGTIITANENFLATVGYDLREIKGQHHRIFCESEYANSPEYKTFWENLNAGQFDTGEYKRLGKGGKEVWIQASYNPILDLDGNPFKVVKYANNITGRVRQAQAMAATQATIEFNLDGTIVTANDLFLGAMGYSLKEIQGQHHRIFCHDELTNSPAYTQFWQMLNRGEAQTGEFKRKNKAGDDIWIQASYTPTYDNNGELKSIIKYASDITAQKEAEEQAAKIKSMVENAPVNIMMADVEGTIGYANPASLNTLKELEAYLPCKAEELVGQSIDIFHKNPAYQRGIIANKNNLPHQAHIKVGPETLDLLVSPIVGANGDYLGPMVTWSVVTKQLEMEESQARIQNMVENAPINIMMADMDLNINYMNKASSETLKKLESLLPVSADKVVGSSVDIFHKNPAHQRNLLSNPNNLPHNAKIELGEETLDLLVSPIRDNKGDYIGPMVTWSVVTDRLRVFNALKDASDTLASSSSELSSASEQMASSAEQTSRQAESVAAATEQADRNAQVVASSAEEMASSINEISRNMQQASSITGEAVGAADKTNQIISKLGDSSQQIGKVVKLITTIAQQTNLLALNATIEAARAGEAGKGFAVVANEVKELAKQTANATDEIGSQIESIQSDSDASVGAIEEISRVISEINNISTTVASSTEEQSSTTTEINRNIQQVATGTQDISKNILGVAEAARMSGEIAGNVQSTSQELASLATRLQDLVAQFKV